MVNDLEADKTKDYGDLTHRMTVSFARELHAKFVLAFEENVSKLKAYVEIVLLIVLCYMVLGTQSW